MHGEAGSVYEEVGYAGLVWHNYDLGRAASGVLNPSVTTDTWLGNQVFNLAKLTVGGVNWAHYLIADGGALFEPLDTVSHHRHPGHVTRDRAFTTWVGLALLVFAVIILLLAMRGDLARQAQRAPDGCLRADARLGGLPAPVDWSRAADDLLPRRRHPDAEAARQTTRCRTTDAIKTPLQQIAARTGAHLRRDVPGGNLPRPAPGAGVHDRRGRPAPGHLGDGGAEEGRLRRDRRPHGRPVPVLHRAAGSRIGAGTLALIQVARTRCSSCSRRCSAIALLIIRLLVVCAPAVAVVALLKPGRHPGRVADRRGRR
ncbi:hypothetical protein HBB16_05695 [Pseudonocardia sp. MCCB 268]|nr:hypothetical protein [Pseudonocardia cytotoxica]